MSTITVGGFRATTFRPTATHHVPAAPVRLTRRGRLVILALFVGLVFVALTMLGGQSAATDEEGTPLPTRTVVVEPGDTLWDIAATVAEPGEVREMIHRIQELNALPSASLDAGQQIAVPIS